MFASSSCRSVVSALAIAIALCGSLVRPAVADDQEFIEEVSVNYVLVPVAVRDGDEFVAELERSDFEILVDGTPVRIESFDNDADAPVSVVLLQDLSGSMHLGDGIARSRELVRCIVGQRSSKDSFALATFAGGRLSVRSLFEANPNKIVDDTRSWRAFGTTALNDAIAWLPDIVLESPSSKRVAVLITDGVDNASALDMQAASNHIEQAELPVFIIGLRSGDPNLLDDSERPAYPRARNLSRLAAQTGGRYYFFDASVQSRDLCNDLRRDLRFHYMLGFATTSSSAPRQREIEVRLQRKVGDQVRVVHRVGYHGSPPLSANEDPDG